MFCLTNFVFKSVGLYEVYLFILFIYLFYKPVHGRKQNKTQIMHLIGNSKGRLGKEH